MLKTSHRYTEFKINHTLFASLSSSHDKRKHSCVVAARTDPGLEHDEFKERRLPFDSREVDRFDVAPSAKIESD
jgi:hypothetical protein